jgi:hypothetical protein
MLPRQRSDSFDLSPNGLVQSEIDKSKGLSGESDVRTELQQTAHHELLRCESVWWLKTLRVATRFAWTLQSSNMPSAKQFQITFSMLPELILPTSRSLPMAQFSLARRG